MVAELVHASHVVIAGFELFRFKGPQAKKLQIPTVALESRKGEAG